MGRIKTTLIKRTANKLFTTHSDKFKPDFAYNKKILTELTDVPSKKLRNVISGYLTRLVKQQNK